MSKSRAFLIHLLISGLVVGAFLALAFFIWYPDLYFDVDGAHNIIAVLAGVDVVLGPLLTLVVFKPDKPRLKLDLGIIAAVQISAFLYGATIIYTERPVYAVFALDHFETVPASKIDTTQIAQPELQTGVLAGPSLAALKLPHDPQVLRVLVNSALEEGGTRLEYRGDLYVPFATMALQVVENAKPLSELLALARDPAGLESGLARAFGETWPSLVYFPLVGKNAVVTMIMDPETGRPVDMLDINPLPRDG